MIAHSLPAPAFGPAQNMHGATYVIDAEFKSSVLGPDNVVIDIGLASSELSRICELLNYKNLDEEPEFKGKLTTTEFLAKEIHNRMGKAVSMQFSGALKITLHESHVASASYEGSVEP